MSHPVEAIASRLITIPCVSFARTIEKIDRISMHPQITNYVLAGVISSDPMLTALALGRANAVSQSDLTQLSNAVMMLGVTTLRGVIREVDPVPEHARKIMSECWALAHAAGTMTRILAKHSALVKMIGTDEETLHAIGLLHDIGTIVAILHYPREYEEASARLQQGEADFAASLKASLGVSGPELGWLLARHWNLPPLIAECIRYHLHPEKSREYGELVALVHVARTLARACGFCAGADIYLDPITDTTLARLGLYPSDFESIITAFYDDMEEQEQYEGSGIHKAIR